MKIPLALIAITALRIFATTEAAFSWRNVLSSRVNRLNHRAGGVFDASHTFKRVQASCPQPDVDNAGQQMIDMAKAASAALGDLVNGRSNTKAQMMYNSVFGIENDPDLRKGYYGIVKDVFDRIARFSNSRSRWVLYCDEKWATYHPFKTTGGDDGTKLGYWTAKDPAEFPSDQHFQGSISGVCGAGTLAWTLHRADVIQLCPVLFNKGVGGTITGNIPVTIPQSRKYATGKQRIDQMESMASVFLHEMAHQAKDTITDVDAIRNDGTKAGTTIKDKLGNVLALGYRQTKSYGWQYVYNLGRYQRPAARQNADSFMNFAIGVYYTGNEWSTGVCR